MNQEYTRRFKIGLSAEFELLHILEEHDLSVWHLRSYGDLLVRVPIGRLGTNYVTFAIDVKVVSTTKTNGIPYSRVYFRKDGTLKFLKLCQAFNCLPLLALKHNSEWYISYTVPKNFDKVRKHGTTIIFEKLSPFPLEQFLKK